MGKVIFVIVLAIAVGWIWAGIAEAEDERKKHQ